MQHRVGGLGDVRVVGHQDDRLAGGVQPAEQLDDLLAPDGVKGAGGLVGEQERGLVRKGAGDREALALAARKDPGHLGGLVGDAQQVEQVASARLGALAVAPGDDRRQRHVLEHAHALKQVEELKDDADVACAGSTRGRPRTRRSWTRRPR